MKNFAVIDETFDINQCGSYHLAIELHDNGLCFAVMDTVRKKFIALHSRAFDDGIELSAQDQFRRALSRDNYLSKVYKTSGLIYVSPDATLIPNSLFDQDKAESIFKFSNQLPERHTVLYNKIQAIDSTIIFSIPEALVGIIDDHPNDISIIHQSCPLIESSSIEARKHSKRDYVHVRAYPDFIDIVVFKKGEFELYNSFAYKTDEDIIFYILYVFEQLDINNSEAKMILSGIAEEDSNFFNIISDYIADIEFEKFNKNFSYSYTLGHLSEHHYTNLINLYLCV